MYVKVQVYVRNESTHDTLTCIHPPKKNTPAAAGLADVRIANEAGADGLHTCGLYIYI